MGSIDNLVLKSSPLTPQPQDPSHIRVLVKALGLNFADVFSLLGLYEAAPKEEFTPGLEFSGVVGYAPEGCPFKVGDRVFGVCRFGAFASHLDLHPDYVRKFPEAWSYEEAASFPVQALTAYYALRELGNLKRGGTVLIHSAAGGVGILSLQMLQKFEAKIIGTVGSQDKAEFLCKKFGLESHQIISRSSGGQVFEDQLTEALNKLGSSGFDIVLDSLGGDYFTPGYNKLVAGGRLIAFGSGSLMPSGSLGYNLVEWAKLGYKFSRRPIIDPIKLTSDNKAVFGFNLIYLYNRVDLFAQLFQEIEALSLDAPKIDQTFSFEDLPSAFHHFQTGKNIGKVVVSIKEASE